MRGSSFLGIRELPSRICCCSIGTQQQWVKQVEHTGTRAGLGSTTGMMELLSL